MLLILSALLVIFETSYVTHKFSYEGASTNPSPGAAANALDREAT